MAGRRDPLPSASALIEKYEMLPPGATVLCAVSGGADSMCLLHYLSQREDLTLHAAHFDHRLRGAESERDAGFVRDWCGQRGIPFHLGGADVAARARERGRGVEETARELRYQFLFHTARELGAVTATAHNAGDNVETVLLHLLRGTGLNGLTGIAPVREGLIRPLLTTTRGEIEAYLERYDIPHVEDSTNQNDDFLRNKVRLRLVPMLEEWSPGFSQRMTAAIPALAADNALLDKLAAAVSGQAEGERELRIAAGAIAGAPESVAVRAVRQLWGRVSPGSYARNTDCAMAHLRAVVELCRSGGASGQVHLPHGVTARREYDALVLTCDDPPPPLESFVPRLGDNPVPGTAWTAVVREGPWPGLVIRCRQTGDTLTLPGRPHKRLKELLIDAKVPRWERDRLPVAADNSGVVAVAGFGGNMDHPLVGLVTFIKREKEEDGAYEHER